MPINVSIRLLLAAAAMTLAACTPPLHQAARDGNVEQIKQLLDEGTDPNASNTDGIPPEFYTFPLHLAVTNGHEAAAALLVERGADVNRKNFPWQNTPLHIAAFRGNANIVQLLLKNGADVNAVQENGATPLDFAITYENDAVARQLRESGASTGAGWNPGDAFLEDFFGTIDDVL